LGSSVVDFLLKKTEPANIAVLVRDSKSDKAEVLKAKEAELRTGDYNDYDSLVEAFQGVEKLYFVSGSDIANRLKQHENVVNAAKAAGVKHVVYTSFIRKNETGSSPISMVSESHIKTEKWVKESGITYTILKHNLYADMVPIFIGGQVLETGSIYLPAGDGKAAFALRDDMAEVGSVILTTDGHENKEYDITADTSVSYSDIAFMISEITGKTISYISPSPEEFTKTMTEAGVPTEYVELFTGFSEAIEQGEFDKTGNTIEALIGRKPVSVKQFLQRLYSHQEVE